MANGKYLNIFVLSFLDRLESIEHDLSYLKSNVNNPSRLEEVEKAAFSFEGQNQINSR